MDTSPGAPPPPPPHALRVEDLGPPDGDSQPQSPYGPPTPWSGRDLLIVLGMGILLSVVLLLVYGGIVSLAASEDSEVYTEGGLILIYVAFGIAGWYFALRRNGATWRDAGLVWPPAHALLAVIPAYIALVLLEGAIALAAESIFGSSPGIEAQLQTGRGTISAAEKLVLLVGAAVAAPVVEEFLFRGLLYRYVRRRTRLPIAIGLTSVLFAVLHGFLGLVPMLFVFGIVMAVMAERYKTIVPSMMLHALNNAVALTLFFVAA